MILICPTCDAKSRINDSNGKKPLARMRCGACTAVFAVSSARRYGAEWDARTAAALARARRSTRSRRPVRSLGQQAAAPAGLLAVVALGVLGVWDKGAPPVGMLDVAAQLQVSSSGTEGFKLIHVVSTPYAPTGGHAGLLVQGEVSNVGPEAKAAPMVAVHVTNTGHALRVRVPAGPGRTLREAKSLGHEDAVQTATVAPGTSVPFVALVPLPKEPMMQPWQVIARF